jgi:intracellular sulfur oxidation DsrE/DsrF family protein
MLRRAFLSTLSSAGPLFALQSPPAAAVPKPADSPIRHRQDEWLDQAPDTHRVVFDTWLADRFGEALGFAGNWIKVNREEYGLSSADIAVVVVARHGTTPFAFNETIWAKYGTIFADNMSTGDKVAHPNPSVNRYAARLADYSKQGLRLAVCNLTLHAYKEIITEKTGATEDIVFKEMTANLIGNAQIVPAGIVAVTRAQEHGYALVSVG